MEDTDEPVHTNWTDKLSNEVQSTGVEVKTDVPVIVPFWITRAFKYCLLIGGLLLGVVVGADSFLPVALLRPLSFS